MPKVSVVMPIYGVEKFVAAAIDSVLAQTYSDFEFIIVDDVSPDRSLEICQGYTDQRIRIISHQQNRGLAGARNTGIRAAVGKYIALLDSDDLWEPEKLAQHVNHLDADPAIGVSFSRSAFINEDGERLNTYQMPKLSGITPGHLLCRNPIGNGSAPVIRREVFADIGFAENLYGEQEIFYFDDRFRQSEDIECWIRIASLTDWKIEGLTEALTLYRLNSGSLSANIPQQLQTWEAVIDKAREHSPELIDAEGGLARAFQLRYLARQAVRLHDGRMALTMCWRALRQDWRILSREPSRTLVTVGAALTQCLVPKSIYKKIEPLAVAAVGQTQKLRMASRRESVTESTADPESDRRERIWFDRLSGSFLIILLLPILFIRSVVAWSCAGRVLDRQHYHGKNNSTLVLRRFAGGRRGRDLARILDIATGRLAWVGPLPIPHSQVLPSASTTKGLSLRPGLISIWRLQRLTGSQYEGSNDPAQYPNHTLKESVTIVVRYVIARLLASEFGARRPDQFELLDVKIDNIDIDESMQRIQQALEASTPTQFAFVNPDCLNIATKHDSYKAVLRRVNTVFADGIGIRIACRMLGITLRDNINGTDLFPLICRSLVEQGKSIYLLGGRPGVTDLVISNMQRELPNLKIAGHRHGYFNAQDGQQIVAEINASGADVLLVAMGAPKQDLWIDEHRQSLGVAVQIGVGGLFDFYSGRISRSPRWLRDIGLEWVWRLIQEPGRMWRRYVLGNPAFLFRVWRQARKEPRRKILKRFSVKETGFWKASIIFQVRHFIWNFALFTGRAARRFFDIAVSATALVILCPFLLVLALLIKLESPGPAIFAQTRVGRWGNYFTMYKFRSMCTEAEAMKKDLLQTNEMDGGVIFKMKEDPRITKMGKFIRKFSIDELPQFWNVLIGDMSLVGPRPPVPSEVDQYSITDRRRLEIKPGITCLWQVSGRSNIAFNEQVALDVDYIESRSLVQDLTILIKTVPAVLFGRGSY